MYVNSYLEAVGRFINLCMEFVKDNKNYEEIESLSDGLRDPDRIEDYFVGDLKVISSLLEENKIKGKNAKDNLNKLRVYVLTQLESHYELINKLLDDLENKTGTEFTRDSREFQDSLKDDIMKLIDKAEKEIVD